MLTNPPFVRLCFLLCLSVSACAVAEESPTLNFGQEESFSWFTQRLNLEESLAKGINRKKGLLQAVNLGASWTPGGDSEDMGLTEVKFGVTLACPAPKFKPFTNSFLIFSPSFSYTSVHWRENEDFPDNLYNAGLSITWMKPLNEIWSIMLTASPSYSGDGKADRETVRCPVMFGATWTPNKRWKVMLGVVYLDRSDIPFLPFGGFVYTPNDDWKFECMAPQPRIARRLTAWSGPNAERWAYLGFGFGGGSWGIRSVGDRSDFAQYREYSALLGYEFISKVGLLKWNAEVGFLFGREMQFEYDTQPNRKLGNSLALRLKCSF